MRALLALVLAAFALWVGAFFVYLVSMALPASAPGERTDALIVLTGGTARVERGFTLLAQEAAPVLFISGVGAQVTQAEMLLAHTSPKTRRAVLRQEPEIVFDYVASSTQTNASEAANFVRQRGYKSIRLITGHYHMPRSLVEFHAALPGVKILREPVVPESFHPRWWNEAGNRRLIWQEFHKYIAASARVFIDRV